ncbi:hypothetical protein L1987_20916 [Smallanthus sonchifolius]|uniref:Uncharacterized protein n=1 Tax=Smallanthus sonchifolius TaxID=185202 RepID=A0ACB9IU45_9ASTR|nr:hypothetical protein L1987_20916 [Smallanthus sonchifolius]
MLASMILEIQKNLVDMPAYGMIRLLQEMFQQQARHDRFEVIRSLISCCTQEGSSVSTHVLKMKGCTDHLARPNSHLSNELDGDIILNSLPKSYDLFTLNYNSNAWDKTILELHMMLKTAEMNMPAPAKSGPVLMIKEGRVKKSESRGKGKKNFKSKGKAKAVAKKPLKDVKCFHCDEVEHWRRNCPKYLAELKQKKSAGGQSSVSALREQGFDYAFDNDFISAYLNGQRAKDLLGLVHTDVCGPLRTMSRSGERYFMTFTDDFSRYGYVYLMKHKHETFEMFKQYQNEVQNQLGKTIKMLQSDRGGKYLSQEFDEHLEKCGIISQITPPGTPQLNGVSESRN